MYVISCNAVRMWKSLFETLSPVRSKCDLIHCCDGERREANKGMKGRKEKKEGES